LQSYYKLTEEYLEEITKECSLDLLILANPTKLYNVDSPEAMQDTPRPSKNKPGEFQDVDNTSVKTMSMSPEKGGVGEEIGKETSHNDEEEPSKKIKVSPRSLHPERK
jgi:hypothetical protein